MRAYRASLGVVAAALIGGSHQTAVLSFSTLSPPVAHRDSFKVQRSSSCRIRNNYCGCRSSGFKLAMRNARGTRSASDLHASSPIGTLPTLEGLPGGSKTTQKSRRGKYPVVELWRREETDDPMLDHDRYSDNDDDDSFTGERRIATRSAQTALEHLRVVLRLGSQQTDAMLETFPALAQVHPDKLDVRAKLVSSRPTTNVRSWWSNQYTESNRCW